MTSDELLIELTDSLTAFYRKHPDGVADGDTKDELGNVIDPTLKRFLAAYDASLTRVTELKEAM